MSHYVGIIPSPLSSLVCHSHRRLSLCVMASNSTNAIVYLRSEFPPAGYPAIIGAVLLASVLFFQVSFVYYKIQPGLIAKLQFYSCLSATISVIGHLTNAFAQYRFTSDGVLLPGSVAPCLLESICGCFGEQSLVLWLICSAIVLILSTNINLLQDELFIERLLMAFHVFVWTTALITTLIPGVQGRLGLNYDTTTEEYGVTEAFCWFIPGETVWEIGQYYAPLLLSVAVSIIALVVMFYHVAKLSTASNLNSDSAAVADHQKFVMIRLVFQLFALSVVLVPDAVNYFIYYDSNHVLLSKITNTLWKCETIVVALIWYSNLRVRSAIASLPFIKSLLSCDETSVARTPVTRPSRGGSAPPIQLSSWSTDNNTTVSFEPTASMLANDVHDAQI